MIWCKPSPAASIHLCAESCSARNAALVRANKHCWCAHRVRRGPSLCCLGAVSIQRSQSHHSRRQAVRLHGHNTRTEWNARRHPWCLLSAARELTVAQVPTHHAAGKLTGCTHTVQQHGGQEHAGKVEHGPEQHTQLLQQRRVTSSCCMRHRSDRGAIHCGQVMNKSVCLTLVK